MATIQDLEKTQGAPCLPCEPTEAIEAEFTGESDLQDTLIEALDLLKKAMILFNYCADPILCKIVSKKERDTMDRLATNIDEFLDDAEQYEDE